MVVRELNDNDMKNWTEFINTSVSKLTFVEGFNFKSCFKLGVEANGELISAIEVEDGNDEVKLYSLPQYREVDFEGILISAAKYYNNCI
ncbi:hypothetical protein [Clostridium felsineum]|uniref:Uncharacterized protein n=1 Tax=Clostridium felsineum TaxID=36839 RepID=A0A1S8MI34_9CLOT|nr:hypothetical protein [Clostridium felsineum]MCR3759037.1 hypothetical protein [Clostridium felsineum]URZ00269.1 hypothetical protein CLAUR_002570 [Clostridium felsineum]URZ07098.1 hypothetical protein CLROS_024310 [Clostridium felsineum]URZ12128.1 hypothetical protein CROST_028450 [Clostridium felsineum]